jgi:hypothetical protein
VASEYVVQIAHRTTGKVHQWAPGLATEVELIENLCARVQAKYAAETPARRWYQPVTWQPAPPRVDLIRAAFQDLLHDLKVQVR